jgi:hypothetical protein
MKMGVSLQIFETCSEIKFLENPSSRKWIVLHRRTEEQTDTTKLTLAFFFAVFRKRLKWCKIQFTTWATVSLFLHTFAKRTSNEAHVFIKKQLINFQNCFDVLSQLCPRNVWKKFSHLKFFIRRHVARKPQVERIWSKHNWPLRM